MFTYAGRYLQSLRLSKIHLNFHNSIYYSYDNDNDYDGNVLLLFCCACLAPLNTLS